MKKFVIAPLLALSMFSATARPAHAGLAIGAIAGDAGKGTLIGLGVGVVAGTAFAITLSHQARTSSSSTVAEGVMTAIAYGFLLYLGTPAIVGVATLLDADAALSESELQEFYRNQYPSIESEEALSGLAALTKAKLADKVRENPNGADTVVTFSREELSSVLGSTSVSGGDFDRIAADLQ